jgi:HEAT repeat protein
MGDERAMGILLGTLKDEAFAVRGYSARALGKLGDERVVGPLLETLKDEVRFVRRDAAEALGRIEDQVLTYGLMRALEHEDNFVRRKAAQVIAYYASNENVLRELSRLATTDPDDEVRNAASEALDKFCRKLQYVSE